MKEKEDKGVRKKILDTKETDEDKVLNMSLRPTSVKEFVGQKDMIENINNRYLLVSN